MALTFLSSGTAPSFCRILGAGAHRPGCVSGFRRAEFQAVVLQGGFCGICSEARDVGDGPGERDGDGRPLDGELLKARCPTARCNAVGCVTVSARGLAPTQRVIEDALTLATLSNPRIGLSFSCSSRLVLHGARASRQPSQRKRAVGRIVARTGPDIRRRRRRRPACVLPEEGTVPAALGSSRRVSCT